MDPKRRTITRDFDLLFDGLQMRAIEKDVDGKKLKFIVGTASSTAIDLYQSIIGPECQVKMLQKLRNLAEQMSNKNSGLTAFLNHSYKIPEDTLGAFTSASLTTRSENGQEFIDLDIECRVTETTPRAVAAWEQVKDGIRHGWSIGAYFLDAHYLSDDPDSADYWTLYVDDIDLLEISLVGIPANQRAWCRSSEDLKEMAVAAAEQIVREARENPEAAAKRYDIEGEQLRRPDVSRSLALRSILHGVGDGVADSSSTSPITGALEQEPGEQLALVPETCGHKDGCTEPKAADSLLCEKHRDAAPIELDTLGSGSPKDLEAHAAAFAAYEASTNAPYNKDALINAVGAFNRYELAKAGSNVGTIASRALTLTDAPATEIADHIRELCSADTVLAKDVALRAADSIDLLVRMTQLQSRIESRDGDALSPNDPRDNLCMAISHIANQVGHGLCIKDAKLAGKAIDCISKAVGGNVVDQPGPNGDEDPSETLYAIEKLEPKSGDLIVIRGVDAQKYASSFDAILEMLPEGVALYCIGDDVVLSIDNDLGAKAKSLEDLNAALSEAQAALVKAQADTTSAEQALGALAANIETRTNEFTELERKIEESKNTRLGRKTVSQSIAERNSSSVDPQHYYDNDAQRRGLQRMAGGESADDVCARDLAGQI